MAEIIIEIPNFEEDLKILDVRTAVLLGNHSKSEFLTLNNFKEIEQESANCVHCQVPEKPVEMRDIEKTLSEFRTLFILLTCLIGILAVIILLMFFK